LRFCLRSSSHVWPLVLIDPAKGGPLGGEGKIVEADETYFGRNEEVRPLKTPRSTPYLKSGWKGKGKTRAIGALVERGGNLRASSIWIT
jgi:hypothetical protein